MPIKRSLNCISGHSCVLYFFDVLFLNSTKVFNLNRSYLGTFLPANTKKIQGTPFVCTKKTFRSPFAHYLAISKACSKILSP